jgi:cysteine desulfurase
MDYMATTPIDPFVLEKMIGYMGPSGHFGNPSSITHPYGRVAAVAVEHARQDVAQLIGATPEDIVFTSGATEANNLAILGASLFYERKGRHIITLSTEHKSVLDSFHHLEQQGFEVTYLKPQPDGLLDLETLSHALRQDTVLVSIMHVNNEIGVIQDIEAIGRMLCHKGVIFHVDGAQSAGKIAIDLASLPVHLMSFSAHKIYGPKGVGALFVRHKPRIRLKAQSFGGAHENGMRSGTLPTHQIVGMGEAFKRASFLYCEEQARILQLREQLWAGINHLPGIALNGSLTKRVSGNLNIRFEGLDNQALLIALHELALSTTSACAASKMKPSYVLKALGLNDASAQSSIRLSLGRFTSKDEIKRTIDIFCEQIPLLQSACKAHKGE